MSLKPAGRERVLTPPNVITTFRIVLFWVPGFLLLQYGFWTAFVSFLILSATDKLDGWLANCNGKKWKTNLGAILDTVADKLLFTTYFVCLCIKLYDQPYYLVPLLLLIAREFWLSLTQGYYKLKYQEVVRTNQDGRIRTVLLFLLGLTLTVPYYDVRWYQWLVLLLFVATYYYTIVSSIQYYGSFSKISHRLRPYLAPWQEQPTYMRQLVTGGWKSPPNLFTLSRVFMSFWALLILILAPEMVAMRWLAVGIIVVASSTDFIDGKLARNMKIVSKLGAWLDPIADKLFIGFTLIGLTIAGRSPIWVTTAILFREVAVVVIQTIVKKYDYEQIPSSWLGKTKMGFQCVAVGMLCAPPFFASFMAYWVLLAAFVLTIASGFEYWDNFTRRVFSKFITRVL